VIYIINLEEQTISFICIFPKTGKFGIENISDNQLEKLLKSYYSELEENILTKIDWESYIP